MLRYVRMSNGAPTIYGICTPVMEGKCTGKCSYTGFSEYMFCTNPSNLDTVGANRVNLVVY